MALLKKLFDQAGYRTRTEVSLPSGQRPADLLVEDWEGQPLAIDVSFRHPQGSWNVDSAVQAVAAGEVEKRAQYLTVCRQHGWAFEPFILSPLGWLGPAGGRSLALLCWAIRRRLMKQKTGWMRILLYFSGYGQFVLRGP